MKRLLTRDLQVAAVLLAVTVVPAPLRAAGQCLGDANGNGFVNFADYGAVAQNFGKPCVNGCETTWQVIQSRLLEAGSCTNRICHGDASSGDLDLRPEVAYANLVGVSSTTVGGFLRVSPGDRTKSLLWLNLAAKTLPDQWDPPLRAMPLDPVPPIGEDLLELVGLWIDAYAPRDTRLAGTDTVSPCPPRFVDNGDGTITDNENSRMWAKRSDDGGFHDKDKLYTWGGRNSPYPPNGTALTEYLAGLNGAGSGYCFAGYCDWRLPTTEELAQIIDSKEVGNKVFAIFKSPCMDNCFYLSCSCDPSSYIWSANSNPLAPSQAMALSSANGDFDSFGKDYEWGVRAVRTIPGENVSIP